MSDDFAVRELVSRAHNADSDSVGFDAPEGLREVLAAVHRDSTSRDATVHSLVRPAQAKGSGLPRLPAEPPAASWRDSSPARPPVLADRPPRLSRRAVLVGSAAAALVASGGVTWAAATLKRSGFFGDGVHPWQNGATTPATTRVGLLWRVDVSSPAAGATTGFAAGSSAYVIPKSGVVISADASTVIASDRTGKLLWKKQLSNAGAVAVRSWQGGLLANDSSTVWLLDPASGAIVYTATVARDERFAHPDAHADQVVVQIYSLVLGADHVFIDLGTAMIALTVKLGLSWRRQRAVLYGQYMPAAQPLGADSTYLAARERTLLSVQLSLFRVTTHSRLWTVPDRFVSQGSDNGGPGGGPGGGPPPGSRTDEAWSHVQARVAGNFVATRDNRIVQVFRRDHGGQLWKVSFDAPVADIFVWGDALLVCADQLTAWNLSDGTQRWHLPLSGARLALAPDNQLYAVTDTTVARIKNGQIDWQVPTPSDFANRIPVVVSVDAKNLYATFASPDSGRATVAAFVING